MDNLTHSLTGAALAEIALAPAAPPLHRRLFLAAGVLASNLPDADLVYTGITPPPLGYLLHHRGHTHTVLGLVAQALVVGLVLAAVPAVRRLDRAARRRLGGLVLVSLAGHLGMDAWNSYGVHPFHPVDSRWYYGDAVFIFEPWLWLLLGAAAAANAQRRWARLALAALLVVLTAVLARVGILPAAVIVALAVAGTVLIVATRGSSPRLRAAAALALGASFVAASFALSARARARTLAALEPERRGRVLDVVLNANPALPLCWAAIALEKDEERGDYVLHRATVSLAPRWVPPRECPSYRFAPPGQGPEAREGVAWNDRRPLPLEPLRAWMRDDCWVRAWLQFSRAPVLEGRVLKDLRFESGRGNFTTMSVAPEGQGRSCPPAMTRWEMPRRDLLAPGP